MECHEVQQRELQSPAPEEEFPMHQCMMVALSVERNFAEKDLEVLVDTKFNRKLSVWK